MICLPRRLHILPWSLAILILALLSGSTPLLAQQTSGSPPPKQGSVKPMGICDPKSDPDCGGGGDTYAPGVGITPAGGTFTAATLVVTIDWWDDNTLDGSTRSITLNGSSVTSSFSYTSSGAGSASSTGTITLQPGSNTLTAQIRDQAGNLGSRMAILNFPGVDVTPDGQAVTVRLSSPQTYDFTVRNTATGSATYNLTAQCSNAVSGCAVTNPVGPITVGAGLQKTVTVSYQSGAANTTGRVTLRAANASNAALVDSGWINVTSVHAYSVAVTPQSAATTLAAYTPSSYVFTVQNTGSTSTTFDLAATCTGATTGCSTGGVTWLTLASQATQTVKVDYQAGAGSSTGSVTLRATMRGDASVTSAGTLSVTTTWPKYLTVNTGFTNTDNQKLGLCANNCFAPVYAHSTVPYFSLGAARSATLIYHGERTAVRPIVAAEVTLAAGAPQPTEITLTVLKNGAALPFTNSDQVLHFRSDAAVLPAGDTLPRRLTGQLNVSTDTTGLYPVQIVVTAVYADHREETKIDTTLMVINNQRAAGLLPVVGWTVAGVQRLYPAQPANAVLIVEGDGSGVAFACASYATPCAGPAGDFSTLQATGSGDSLIYTRAYPDSTKVSFNYLGQMKRAVDRWGNATDFEYSGGKLSKILDPFMTYGGKRTAIEFRYSTRTITIATPGPKGDSASAKRGTVVTYDINGRVTAFRDPDSVSTSLGYDASGRLATITDRRGSTTTYTYDPVTWKLTRTELPQIPVDVGGGATQMQTPALRYRAGQTVGVPTTSTSATMLALPVRVDTAWAIVVGADGDTTRFTVDRWGQPLVIKDALANVTTIARTRIFATAVTNPRGQTDRYSYTGPFLTRVEPYRQPATTMGYDAWGMVASVSGGGAPSRTATYSASTRTITEAVDGGYATVRWLDARGRDTLVTDPASHKTRFRYDATFGNLERTTAAAGQWAQVTYDGYGRDSLTSVSGRPKAAVRLYDLLNRVTATYDTVGATPMRLTYDNLFLTTVQDPKGQVYRTEVNALGWPTKVYDPADTVSWARYQSYGYSPGGLVKSARNRRGQWTYLQYDVLGRLTSRRESLAPADSDSFQYSPDSRIVVGRNSLSIDSVFVGDAGADSVVTRFVGGTLRFARRHSATAGTTADTTTITTNVSGLTFSPRRYHWSQNRGVLDSIVVGTTAVRFGYNGELQRAATIYPDYVRTEEGTTTHSAYGYSFNSALLDSAFRREYQYDSLSRITSEARLLRYYERPYGDSLGTSYEVRNYRYNGVGALGSYQRTRTQSRVCHLDWGCIPSGVFPYQTYGYPEYDGARNLLAQVDSTWGNTRLTATFNPGNRLTSWAGASFTYDLDGNRATRLSGGVTTTYTWSATGQLLSVQQGSTTVAYGYNAFGELVRRQMNGATDRYFLWDEGQLLAELDGTAKQKINEYAYRPGTDQPLALLSGGSSTLRFFQTDGRGDVIGLSEGINDVQQLVYGPWGEREVERGPVMLEASRLGWKGLMWEGGVTSLYYVRARWYDPATRSFISEDPIGLAGGVNTYAFAGNDPINGRDPSGLNAGDPVCPEDTKQVGRVVDAESGAVSIACQGGGPGDGIVIITGLPPVDVIANVPRDEEPRWNDPWPAFSGSTLIGPPGGSQSFGNTLRTWGQDGRPLDFDFHKPHGNQTYPHAHEYEWTENGWRRVTNPPWREVRPGELSSPWDPRESLLRGFLTQLVKLLGRGPSSVPLIMVEPGCRSRIPGVCS